MFKQKTNNTEKLYRCHDFGCNRFWVKCIMYNKRKYAILGIVEFLQYLKLKNKHRMKNIEDELHDIDVNFSNMSSLYKYIEVCEINDNKIKNIKHFPKNSELKHICDIIEKNETKIAQTKTVGGQKSDINSNTTKRNKTYLRKNYPFPGEHSYSFSHSGPEKHRKYILEQSYQHLINIIGSISTLINKKIKNNFLIETYKMIKTIKTLQNDAIKNIKNKPLYQRAKDLHVVYSINCLPMFAFVDNNKGCKIATYYTVAISRLGILNIFFGYDDGFENINQRNKDIITKIKKFNKYQNVTIFNYDTIIKNVTNVVDTFKEYVHRKGKCIEISVKPSKHINTKPIKKETIMKKCNHDKEKVYYEVQLENIIKDLLGGNCITIERKKYH